MSVDGTNFKESYDVRVPVSGSAITGICLGDVAGTVDVDNVILPPFSGSSVQVHAVTQDGRFSSNNVYVKKKMLNLDAYFRLSPISVKYADVLSSYQVSSFAIDAFFSSDGTYSPESIVHIPQIVRSAKMDRTIRVFVNSGGRFCQISVDNKSSFSSCTAVGEGARIAYDTVCSIDSSRYSSGVKKVFISMDDGFGVEDLSFMLQMP